MPTYWGKRTAWSATPALRPTGYYLAPVDVATITVPSAVVGKGSTIRVGAHKQDRSGSGPVRRFFPISNKFSITSTTNEVLGLSPRRNVPYDA